jgi:hypothetical protein
MLGLMISSCIQMCDMRGQELAHCIHMMIHG